MTASRPDTWMPLYIGDYLCDTTHLTTEQHGAYMLLLMTCWKRGGHLPNDDAQLAQIARLTPAKWKAMKVTILDFFLIADQSVTHKRINEELARAASFLASRSENGKKGGRPKLDQSQQKAGGSSSFGKTAAVGKLPETTSPSPSPSPSTKENTTTPLPPPGAGDDPSVVVVDAFLRLRDEMFPNESRLPAVTSTLKTQAKDHLAGDVPVELVVEVIEREMRKVAAAGDEPAPTSLAAFNLSLPAAIRAHRRAAGRSAAAAPRNGRAPEPEFVPTEEPWPQRLRWLQGGKEWRDETWGPPPGAAGCRVPEKFLKEFGHGVDA